MKVAIIIDTWFPFIGGGQINAWEISRLLAKKGVEIEIITRNNGHYKLSCPKNLKVTKLGSKSRIEDNVSRCLFLISSFLYIYKKDFDLVHAHAFLSGIVAKLLTITKGTPSVFTVHGTSIGTNLTSYFSLMMEKIILTKLKYSAQITVSRDFLKVKNVNKNIKYIPNGVDEIFLRKKKVKRNNIILCVARLHPQKNLSGLVKAFREISSEFPSYNLVIAGRGPQKDEINSLVKNLKLQKKVKLIGEVDKENLNKLYSSSKLFVLPSIYEGQPLSLLEAMASRLPVVVSRVGDNPYIIKDSINGYLIKGGASPSNIASSIRKAIKNMNLDSMEDKGFQTVINEYTWALSAKKTYALYSKTVQL